MKNNRTSNLVIGIDLGDRKHSICVTDKNGKIVREFSIDNRKQALLTLTEKYPGARVAIEVGTHSPWISRLLSENGMSVTVANARKLRAIYENERKCDKCDAQMLAKLLRVDRELLHPVHHVSEASQRDQLQIKMRDTLVRQRVSAISSLRVALKSLGIRLPSPASNAFGKAAREHLAEHPELLETLEPTIAGIDSLSTQIKRYEKKIATTARENYPAAQLLQQIPGIGPITSFCFVLCVEDPARFEDPRDVGAWLGLVPRRDQSGKSDKQLPITKAGNRYLRCLLVQSAQYLLGHFGPDCDLRRYGLRIAAKGGKAAKKKAVIAVARKLAVLMIALWKSGESYQPLLGDKAA